MVLVVVELAIAHTHELLRVVVSETLGAEPAAVLLAVAPMAAEPFVPEMSAPIKPANSALTLAADAEKLIVELATDIGVAAKALHTSTQPVAALARDANTQVSPALVMELTVVAALLKLTNAKSVTLGTLVCKLAMVMLVAETEMLLVVNSSGLSGKNAGRASSINRAKQIQVEATEQVLFCPGVAVMGSGRV